MRVLVVDDEPQARRRLAIMLEELDVEVAGEAANGVEALRLVEERRPDVLLLDIAMPEVDGFDVVRHLPKPAPLVIFQTAYAEFALKAFEHEALDYVVKPVTLERLRGSLERASRRLAVPARPALGAELVAQLREALGHNTPVPTRLLVREGEAHRLVPLREIVRCAVRDGQVRVHAGGKVYGADYTMAELEDRLRGRFVRPNRAELVHIDRIERILNDPDGTAALVLADGTRVHVTRRRAAAVREALAG